MPIAKHGAEQEVWKVQKEICKRREIFPNFLGELQTQIRKVPTWLLCLIDLILEIFQLISLLWLLGHFIVVF